MTTVPHRTGFLTSTFSSNGIFSYVRSEEFTDSSETIRNLAVASCLVQAQPKNTYVFVVNMRNSPLTIGKRLEAGLFRGDTRNTPRGET